MPTDFLGLLHRDHMDLLQELSQLLDPAASPPELRGSLDGVRLGLIAHCEAEDIVLGPFEIVPALHVLVTQARAAHRAQEAALHDLVSARPGTTTWRERAEHLRDLVRCHAAQEEEQLLPALRAHTADYARLAGRFATERMRQIAMLQPSAPVVFSYAAAG